MLRCFCCALLILLVSLCPSSPLSAGIEVELNDGRILTPTRIEWGPSSTLVLETESKNKRVMTSLPLEEIQRLSIDDSHYDQTTIQLAAANSNFIEPATFQIMEAEREAEREAAEKTHPPVTELVTTVPCPRVCRRGVIIGIQDDPLSAYERPLSQVYPDGVPTLERGFALELMRSQVAQQILGAPASPAGFPPPPEAAPISGRLTQISVQATPLNLEGKSDWNALAIRVLGFDRLGQPAQLSGTVKIHLYGARQLLLPVWDQQFLAKPLKAISLAQWTRNCSTTAGSHTPRVRNMYGVGGASDQTWIVRLPTPLPAQNPNVFAFGTVQVSLAAPGKGTFEATANAVPLKQVSLDRDLSLVNSGTRFFPSETTSSGLYRMKRLNYNAASRPSSRTLPIQP